MRSSCSVYFWSLRECTRMFVAALSIIVSTSKLPKWPSPTKWKNKFWNPHPMDYYTSVKVNVLHTAVPMNLTECRAKAVHRKWAHAIWFHLYKGKNETSWTNLRGWEFPFVERGQWLGGSTVRRWCPDFWLQGFVNFVNSFQALYLICIFFLKYILF